MSNNSGNSYIGKLPPEDYLVEVSRGNVPGASCVLKFGINESIDIGSTPEEIWSYGRAYVFPTAAAVLRISSTSVADTSAGTGARIITIQGLDSNYVEVEVDVTMNGLSNVDTTQTFIRVLRAFVKTAGTSEYNVGSIGIRHQGTGTPVVAEIPATMGQTQMAVYTIPAGKSAYLTSLSGSITKKNSGSATIELWQRDAVSPVRKLQSSMSISIGGSTTYRKEFDFKKFPEKTDLYVRCPYVSANKMSVFSNFGLILIDD